jgi:hypothetical protein
MPRFSLDKILSQYHLTLVLLTYCSRLAVLINYLVAEPENSASLIPKPDVRHDPEPVHTPPSEPFSLVLQIHQFSGSKTPGFNTSNAKAFHQTQY